MPLPAEAAKGATDKFLNVQFPVVMRVLLPGLLATAAFYPEVVWALQRIPSIAEYSWQRLAVYAVIVFVLGALISMMSGEIYKVYEGRNWPPGPFKWGKKRQGARVLRLKKIIEDSKSKVDSDEAWAKLRDYPMDESREPEATYPTILGNILAGYERYPLERYGMDSIFYWPRLWLEVDKDNKEAIDSQWSIADGLLALSAVSVVGGIVWILAFVVASTAVAFPLPFAAAYLSLLGGVGWIVLAYGWYKLSLPFHRQNGDVFKSLFDLYRSKIWDVTCLRPDEVEIWKATWLYLQYLYLKCPNCRKYTPVGSTTCKNCGFGLIELNESWLKSGKFPM
jgi:hypothetical protein